MANVEVACYLVLEVKSVPELAEFCDRKHRQSGGRVDDDQLMLGHINTNQYEDIPEEQRYWLVHKGGYTIVRLLELLPDGRALVRVAGREMTVDSTDIDRMNPTHLDRVGDVAALCYLNETSTVHLLRQRFGCNLLYTNAGLISLVCLTSVEEGAVGQDRLVSLFKGCRRGQMPAHIYATAQQVYRNLQMTGQNQCIVLTGNSGSGKTTQLRNFVHYLAEVAGWTRSLPYEKLALALGVVEAFGHAASTLHRDSTRFLHLFSLGFDKAAALRSVRLQVSLLEADRVVRRQKGEASFHVFYYLWEGAEGALRERLQLDSIEQPSIVPHCKEDDRQSAKEAWTRLQHALKELGLSENQLSAVASVLAAILHIQAAGCTPGSAQRAHFLRVAHAQQAAALLGITTEDLGNAVFRGKTSSSTVNSKVTATSRISLTSRGPDAPEALVSFCAGLYQELFYSIIEFINKALLSNAACTWISVLDYTGSSFHTSWAEANGQRPLALNDLVHNYINERVAELFYNVCFVEAQEVYSREQIDVEMEMPLVSPCPLTRLLDQRQQLLSCTDIDRRSEEKRGLFAILEEESMFPGATDESLLERIFVHLGDESRLIHRGSRPMQFVLEHAMSCYPTTYDVTGWVKQAQPCESAAAARPLLVQSKSPQLASLFGASLPTDASKLRRATQAAQFELNARRSISGFFANISGQIDYVFSSLRRGHRSHFVHCIQPSPNMRSTSGSYETIDVPFVRGQLRSILLIDSIRANNRGYPERVSFRDFRRRFGCLVEDELNSSIDNALDDRAAVSKILEGMDIHQHRYRLGISQVLLSADVLCELEDRRELSLSGLVTAFQRECRRHLASKWLQRRRVLETAIRCIQVQQKYILSGRHFVGTKVSI
ncbi:Myosin-XVIIIa [Trichostrongylus colubriformis]|uniref:Myosin-XVIIIa n=1 Tax=Trichostrongylus colubriformis TaxID=6319 RepID=A0AAN8IVE8_TRICO